MSAAAPAAALVGRRWPRHWDALACALLLLLPALAHAPAWLESRLLGPGDGGVLHYPLRALVWQAYRHGELPGWNPSIFTGTPLLAGYRAGAFHPLMLLLALLPPFAAFQVLVLFSLGAAGALFHLYLRQLGAHPLGAYVGGLCYALGPYLVGHLDDTSTLVAAPCLPLLLIALESHVRRPGGAPLPVALALALLLLSGSPEAVRAGAALLALRLLLAHTLGARAPGPRPLHSALTVLAGVLLAAPQLLPTLLAATAAGRQVSGIASLQDGLPGATGLVLRYASHTPAPAFALAALPLVFTLPAVPVLGGALLLCLVLQWGRGPLAAPGALALLFDLGLAALCGLSLSAQWQQRLTPLGRRLRMYLLFALLGSAAALSVAAAAIGPLPQSLAGSVGVLALALILYLSLATSSRRGAAALFVLPLSVSFLLQPHGRAVWDTAPRRTELERGTVTREAIDRAMGEARGLRVLSLTDRWPTEAADLAYGNLSALAGRNSANGYDPMVSLRTRAALGGMSAFGALPPGFFRTDPARFEQLGLHWVQVPASRLLGAEWPGPALDLAVLAGAPRFFPVPITAATHLVVVSSLADAVALHEEEPVVEVSVRVPSGHELPLRLRAGIDTAEWALERADVKPVAMHRAAPVFESFEAAGFQGYRYVAELPLPGRYLVDGIRLTRLAGRGRFTLSRLALRDGTRAPQPLSALAAFVSDSGLFTETAAAPDVRLFSLVRPQGIARVVAGLRVLDSQTELLQVLAQPTASGFDARAQALGLRSDLDGVQLDGPAHASRADVVRVAGSRIDLRAEGRGLLVVAEGWDAGWSARLDGAPARLLRLNHAQMGLLLGPGPHRVALRYRPVGLRPGIGLAGCGVALLFGLARRSVTAMKAATAGGPED